MRTTVRWLSIWVTLLLLLSCALPFAAFAQEGETPPDNPALTAAQRDCILQSKTVPVTIGIIPNLFPMSIYDVDKKEFSGIIIEMLKLVSKHTGLVFAYQPIELERVTPIESLKEKNTRLVAGILRSEEFLSDPEIVVSEAMFDGSIVFVGRKGHNFIEDGENKTIAILNGFQVATEYVQKNFPDYKILFCPTTEECLSAVANKKADATLHNKYGLNYLLQDPHYEKLEMIPMLSLSLSNCIAGLAQDDSALMEVVNGGLASISSEEYNYVLINYTIGNSYQMAASDILYKYRVAFAVIAVLLLIIFGGVLLIILIRQKSTAKLAAAYAQTKQALAAAERASEAKGQFTSRMSHEIRTPLNAVMGYTEMAKNNIQNPQKVLDCISKSELAAKHLLAVLNDVLDLSSIESGKIKIAHTAFDLKQLISAATSIYYAQTKQKGVLFEVLLPNLTEEKLIGDGLRLNQILMNLLSNAVKFTPKGGTVCLTAEQLILQGSTVYFRFTVADTGIGMKNEFMQHMFLAYEQESSDIAQTYGGSGLGLAITKNLVTMMGGTIHAESDQGKGSVFSVDLPFEIDLAARSAGRGQYDFSRLSALIAEEDQSSCEYMQRLFMRCGVHTDVVASGAAAVTRLMRAAQEQRAYDLCLITPTLPDMSFAEVLGQIRSIGLKNPPVMIPVAYDSSEMPEEAMQPGVQRVVTKPLFQSTMFDLLVDLYGGVAPRQQNVAPAYRFDGKRLLLAEDNEMNREIATDLLTSVGFAVDTAQNGKQAVELFESSEAERYAAILMDIQMPVMNGHEAVRVIRLSEHPRAKTIPIIAMTANAFVQDVSAALAAGMNDHVAKPIDTELLYSVLQKQIGGRTQ